MPCSLLPAAETCPHRLNQLLTSESARVVFFCLFSFFVRDVTVLYLSAKAKCDTRWQELHAFAVNSPSYPNTAYITYFTGCFQLHVQYLFSYPALLFAFNSLERIQSKYNYV